MQDVSAQDKLIYFVFLLVHLAKTVCADSYTKLTVLRWFFSIIDCIHLSTRFFCNKNDLLILLIFMIRFVAAMITMAPHRPLTINRPNKPHLW